MPAAPQILKTIKLKLGTTEFNTDVIDAAVVPATPTELAVTTLDGTTHTDSGPIAWAIELTCIIDFDSVRPGLAYYLKQNAGTSVAFELNAYSPSGTGSTTQPQLTGTCKLVPLPYGGAGNQFAQASVRLPITGTPVTDVTP